MIKTVDTDEADPLVSPEEGKHGQAKRTSRTIIIEPVIFIYSAFALVTIPIGEQFVYDRIAQTYGLDPEEVRANKSQSNGCQFENTSDHMYILQQKIQHDSSEWLLYLGVAAAVPGVVSTILLGTYSDLAGRKAAILAPNIGGLLKVLSFLAVSYFNLPVQYMLLGFLLDGVSGSQMSMWMSGFAYIADVTSETERSFRVTLLEASIGFGAATSQIGVGYWIQASGYNYPFWFLAGLALLNISYIIIFVPETIRRIPGQKLCTIENYTQIFRLFAKDDGSGRKWKLRLLMLIAFPIALVMTSSADVQALFMLNSPLCFDSVLIGFFRAGCVLSMQIGSLIGVKVLGRWLSDIWLCFIGSLFSTAYCLLNAFAVTPFLMYAVAVVALFSSTPIPMVRSMSSKIVHANEQGTVAAGIAFVQTLANLIGNPASTAIYRQSVAYWNGLVFLVQAGCGGVGAVLSLWYIKRIRGEASDILMAASINNQ